MTLGRLFLLFVAVPLADLTLLVWVGERLGFWPTVATVVLTAAVGSWLARREGTAAWRRVRGKLGAGGLPGPELTDGLIILVAGVLLLTPGFITDVVGILGLLPPTRALGRRALAERFRRAVESGRVRVASGGMGGPFGAPFGAAGRGPMGGVGAPHEPTVEDAEVVEETSRPLSTGAPEA